MPRVGRTRVGEYACYRPLCLRGFRDSYALSRHEKAHMERKDFICPHCGAAFAQKIGLKVHIACKHERNFPYACRFSPCGAAFNDPSTRTKHYKTEHADVYHACTRSRVVRVIKAEPKVEDITSPGDATPASKPLSPALGVMSSPPDAPSLRATLTASASPPSASSTPELAHRTAPGENELVFVFESWMYNTSLPDNGYAHGTVSSSERRHTPVQQPISFPECTAHPTFQAAASQGLPATDAHPYFPMVGRNSDNEITVDPAILHVKVPAATSTAPTGQWSTPSTMPMPAFHRPLNFRLNNRFLNIGLPR